MSSIIDVISNARILRRWRRAAQDAPEAPLDTLRQQRQLARRLRSQLDRLIHVADGRLALPAIGSNSFAVPHGTDWSWRPELWRGPLPNPGMSSVQSKSRLGREATLYHDCEHSEITLRQLRNQREEDLAPFGLRLDVFKFDGSFLSLVIELPDDSVKGLQKRHVIQVNTIVEMEKPLEIFLRLNVKHGPNTEQIVRELPLHEEDVSVAFDLAYSQLNERRVERAWLDLIFEGPEMNQVILRDLTFARYPRADL